MKYSKSQSGFTMIELLIATTVFAMVLMVILASFLQIGRMYYKGVSVSSTYDAARSVTESITNDIKNAGGYQLGGTVGDTSWFCIGLHRYSYTFFNQVNGVDINSTTSLSGIRVATITSGCPAPSGVAGGTAGSEVQQLLGSGMQLNAFDNCTNGYAGGCSAATPPTCNNTRCNIHIHIVFYGVDRDVFTSHIAGDAYDTPAEALRAPDAYCSGGLVSTQFCAEADINTSVALRY